MRQNPNHKRPRNRGNLGGRKPSNNRNQTFDSNGPSVRIRGNAFQVHEKYLTLARDAYSSGDRVMAENYFQHAEHYYRIVNATTDPATGGQRINGHSNGYHGALDEEEYDDGDDYGRTVLSQSYRARPERDLQPGQLSDQPSEGGDEDDDQGPEQSADQGGNRQQGERHGERQAERQGGERQGGERQGGERGGDRSGDRGRRRGRRSNGPDGGRRPDEAQDGNRRPDDDGRVAAEGVQTGSRVDPAPVPVAEPVAQAAPPRPVEPVAAQPADAGGPDAVERPRRRPRRRPVAEAAGEGPGRDGDEEPVLI